jgi:hypothetical protein
MKTIAMLILCLAFAAVSFAAEGVGLSPGGQAVQSLLTGVVFPVLTALLMGFVGLVLKKLVTKYNLDIDASRQAELEALVGRGIAYAEEKAAALAKEKVKTLTGNDKLDIAIAHIVEASPKVSQAQAEKLVHTVLGKMYGVGASGTTAVI